MAKITVNTLFDKKAKGEKIAMLTAYDYSTAKLLDESGIDLILVGDSLGMVVLGYESTIPVTMEEMLHHCRAVVRGVSNAMVVGDMPFMSYQSSAKKAVENAGRFLKEAGVNAVKLEGGSEVAGKVRAIIQAGIPVMGHIGLTPQSINQLGGYKVQGKDEEAAAQIIADAKSLEEAGAFSIVLECVPRDLSRKITESIGIPTISCGAGPDCDGQVLVTDDMLGKYEKTAKFVKKYASIGQTYKDAVSSYIKDVKSGSFPADEHCY